MLTFLTLFVAAQSDTVVLRESPCVSCAIRVESVARLGTASGDGMVTTHRVVVEVDPRGRYLVTTAPTQLAVFEPSGTFLRVVGRSGGGPGEYRRIWRVASSQHAIVIYDDVARRRTELAPDFSVRSTRSFQEAPWSVLLRPDGGGIMSAIVPSRNEVGYLLHALDASGQRTASRQLSGIPYREDLSELFRRTLSHSATGDAFWSAHYREYAFERCRWDRSSCDVFVRAARWFPASVSGDWTERMGTNPPPSFLVSVSEAEPDVLWTLSWVADARWTDALRQVTTTEFEIVEFDRYFDSVIEHVDLASGRVLASRRFDEVFKGFVAPGRIWRYAEDPDGFGRIEIGRLVLDPRSTTRRQP